MIPIERFLKDPRVVDTAASLRDKFGHAEFSDVVDAEGLQYVDLVLQGGGVLGVALVGYVYALEQVGLRFRSVAGTSAGAITALMVAAVAEPRAQKSRQLLEVMASTEFDKFLDGKPVCRDFSRSLADDMTMPRRIWLGVWSYYVSARRRLGLHPGKLFLDWLRGQLEAVGIQTCRQLRDRMSHVPPGLHVRPDRLFREEISPDRLNGLFPGELAIVAVDAATMTKFVFPRMSDLVFADPDTRSPAEFVRASMSIPGFFEPYRLERLPMNGELRPLWDQKTGFVPDELFREHIFVDGGVMSNFPIAEFHHPELVPLLPTFGAKLGPVRRGARIGTLGELALATFDSARQALDYDFLYRNPDYNCLIEVIDTSGHSWLDFDMPAEEQVDLFLSGVKAATNFLQGFDWDQYKQFRAKQADAHDASLHPPAPAAGIG